MNIDNTTIQIIGWIITVIFGGAGVGGLITSLKTKKAIKVSKEEEKVKRAEAAQIIEDTAAQQVMRVRGEAERAEQKVRAAEKEAERIRNESARWESECSLLRGEVNEMRCRLDTDMEACRREIKELQSEVARLKSKNQKLLKAIEDLVKQVRRRGEIPNCPEELISEGE